MANPTKSSMLFHMFLMLMVLLLLIGAGMMVYGIAHNTPVAPTLPGNFNLARLPHA